jgi:hypothetical protein
MIEMNHVDTDILRKFSSAENGASFIVPLSILVPSQTNDGVETDQENPLEVCYNNASFTIVHGHHRYYTMQKRGIKSVAVKKVPNPWIQ